MGADKPDPVEALSNRLSDLCVGLEDFTEEGSRERLLNILALLRDLRAAMCAFDTSAVAVLRQQDVPWAEIASKLGKTHEDTWQQFRLAEGEYDVAEQHLAALLVPRVPPNEATLIRGNIYTRENLKKLFIIHAASLYTGIFRYKKRREIWLFVTENKQADRVQFVDKLSGDNLYWQGQPKGRTDSIIIDHKLANENLLLFYRKAKYEFEGAGFRYEGAFEYASHSGSPPTNFVLRRIAS
jgi:hypothetical protein